MPSIVEIVSTLAPIAKELPWFLITVFICVAIYKVVKFLAHKLFDDEKGLITNLINEQRSFVESVKVTNEKLTTRVIETDIRIEKIETDIGEVKSDIKIIKNQIEK